MSIVLSDHREVGSGSFGKVFVGDHEGRSYATKRRYITIGNGIPTGCIHLNEIDIMCRLKHPRLLRCRTIQRINPIPDNFTTSSLDPMGRSTNVSYRADLVYVLTDAAKHDLGSTTLSIDKMRECMWQVLDAILYLHSNDIIHRDIKPTNILMFDDQDIDVRLCDYDMCITLDDGRSYPRAMTPEYTPPEILSQGSDVIYTSAVDIWGAGHVMYQLIKGEIILSRGVLHEEEIDGYFLFCTNKLLWNGDKDLTDPAYTAPEMDLDLGDEEANDLLSHMLDCDPEKRWTARQCMEHPFFQGREVPHYINDTNHIHEVPHLTEEMLTVFDEKMDSMFDDSWYGFFLGLDILMRVVTKKYRGNPRDLAICCFNLGMKYFDKEYADTIDIGPEVAKRVEYAIIAGKLSGSIYRDTVYNHIGKDGDKVYKYITARELYPCKHHDLVRAIKNKIL